MTTPIANVAITDTFETWRTRTNQMAYALSANVVTLDQYVASDVLAKLLTVDGAASGIDSDLLDGQHGAYYLSAASYTAADVKTKLLTVDGAASGIDSDLLDGQHGTYYLSAANLTGTIPDAVLTGSYTGLTNITASGTITIPNANTQQYLTSTNFLRIPNVQSGYMEATGTSTGAIKIALPVSWTSNLVKGRLEVFDYSTNESFSVFFAGYNYGGTSTWSNNSAYIVGNPSVDRNFTVRFGHDGTKCCIYIGELASTWSYLRCELKDVHVSLSAVTDASWLSGWAISVESTAFGTITGTITGTQVGRVVGAGTIWHSDNHGPASGLNADLLDGYHASDFLTGVTYTAADVLAKLLTVDGATSGVDADLLDGQHGAYYQSASNLIAGTLPAARFDDTSHGTRAGGTLHASANSTVAGFFAAADKVKLDAITYSAADVLSKLLTVDGAASGLDSDLLDGQQGSYYQSASNLTAGTVPAARFDDTSHGARAGGTLHASANSTVAGFFAAADKVKLDAITYSAADVLSKLLTVDGAASGIDADLLDGQQGTYYTNASNLNAGTVPAARLSFTIGDYALIASPTFTGVPAAPTAGSGTNTTQIATTAFVTTAVAGSPKGAPDAVLEDQKASGTAGGTSVAATWSTRVLNTEVRDPSALITLTSNQFVPSQSGWVEWTSPIYGAGNFKTRLYNVTNSVVTAYGTQKWCPGGANMEDSSGGAPVVAGKTYRVEYYAQYAVATNGLGIAVTQGTEVYTRVQYWRT